jgi:predicted transposase/invertase (TIGR01784 family)
MSKGGLVGEHDRGYRLLFSHPEMVADLLREFVREEWVRDLDFSTLEKVPGSYVTPDLSSRESDVVWRIRWGPDSLLYIYLLIEFQSTVDPFMALRMMVYLGLLCQDLVKRQDLTRSGKLPPVLPLVLYNGHAPWSAAQEVAELIEEIPDGLERYQPRLRYCLLDEMRMVDSELEPLRNLVAALFRLEKSRDPEDLQRILTPLIEWLRLPGLEELRRAFAVYVVKALLPARVPGIEIPEVADLQEVKSMLAENVKEWTHQWKQEGIEAGRQEGLKEGLREGLKEGQEDALAKARGVLLRDLEERFGPLPVAVQATVDAIASIEDLTDFVFRAGAASSLTDLTADPK